MQETYGVDSNHFVIITLDASGRKIYVPYYTNNRVSRYKQYTKNGKGVVCRSLEAALKVMGR